MTEQEILNAAYTLLEGDVSNWGTSSDEYLAGRRYANMAVGTWERYLNTRWAQLWTTLTASTQQGLVKTLTAGTYTYTAPTDMAFPCSYVRTIDTAGNSTIYQVVPAERLAELTGSSENFVYFTGNPKDSYILHFNPNLTLTTGHTLAYEYYKTATTYTATSTVSEVPDPYFVVMYVAAMFTKDEDPDLYREYRDEARARLENMRTDNLIGLYGVDDRVIGTLTDDSFGFGN